jgi:murein DD-endopeptidase MepM/ murein hydrolase activator NlpD
MFQRRPSGPASSRPGRRRASTGRLSRTLRGTLAGCVAGLAAGAVLLGAGPAVAAPAPPNPTDGQIGAAQGERQAAAAEVGRIRGLLAATQAELEKVSVRAEAAGVAYLVAEEALAEAQAAAEATAVQLRKAAEGVAAAKSRIAAFARDSYVNGSSLSSPAVLLSAEGPGELIQRAALLDYVAANKVDVLGRLEVARIQQANADSAARAARDEMASAEEAAADAKAAADDQLAAQESAYAEVSAQKATYDQQLQAAQIHLLRLQGARNAYQQWASQKAAAEAAARAAAEKAAREAAVRAAAVRAAAARDEATSGGSGGGGGDEGVGGGGGSYVFPTSGWISSCYGYRWGRLHGGVDVAAPIGTNVYAVHTGVVERSGPATGFGSAVYIRGDDGAVTVYGHVNQDFVYAGQRVVAGQLIAEVGNKGRSTGPHLHFEVHPNGRMYSGQVNPMPWLRARGVSVSGC